MRKMIKKTGFTLIELLIVVVIMGILLALISSNLLGARQRAQDNQKKSNLNQLKTALQSYYVQYHKYPASTNGLTIFGCGTGGTSSCGTSFTADNIEFLSKFAKTGSFYEFRYYQCNSGDDYRIKVNLSNSSDSDIADSKLKCPSATCVGQSLTYDTTTNSDYVLCSQ